MLSSIRGRDFEEVGVKIKEQFQVGFNKGMSKVMRQLFPPEKGGEEAT